MFYLQLARVPVRIAAGPDVLVVQKATRRQLAELAAGVVGPNMDKLTAGMDDVRRREFLLFYQTYGVDVGDIRRLVRTDEGATQLCRACLLAAEVRDAKTDKPRPAKTAAEVDALLDASGVGVRVSLAAVLADLDDSSLYQAPLPPDDEGKADPLARSGPPASPA